MIKAVFFDLDGTVADTNGLIYESFRRLFHEKMGLPVPDEEIYGLFGEPLVVSLKRYGAESEEFLSYYRDFNEGQHDIMIREFDGVKEALESLEETEEVFYYLCPVCGNLEKFVPEKCSICGVPGDKFIKY